jgi:translation initiation factor 3 subunit H
MSALSEMVMDPVPPVREVVVDTLAALRIMKHVNDNSTLVAGSLLGVPVDGVLEVTYSFALPSPKSESADAPAEEDLDDAEYKSEMMKMLSDVNVDNNCVGWYQSMHMGTICTTEVVNFQYSYQSSEEISENSIVIMYDPSLSTRGEVVLKAFRLSQEFMKMKKDKITAYIKPSEILEELPLSIRSCGHSAAFVRGLVDSHADVLQSDFDALNMQESEGFLEKHVDMMDSWLDYIMAEQQRIQQTVRGSSKLRQDQLRTFSKRLQEARENEEDPLKVRFDTLKLKQIDVGNRTDHLLTLAQLDKYCQQLNEHIGTTVHKLNITNELNATN